MCSAGVSEILSFCLVWSRFAILKFLRVTQLRLPSLHVISELQITINLQEVVFGFINNGWVTTPPECLHSASKRIRESCRKLLGVLKCLGYETLINLQKARKFGVKVETPYLVHPTGSLYFRTCYICSMKYLQYGTLQGGVSPLTLNFLACVSLKYMLNFSPVLFFIFNFLSLLKEGPC